MHCRCQEGGKQNADKNAMGSINSLSNSYLQSVLSTFSNSVNNPGSTTSAAASSASGIGAPSDSGQLSPFAQLLSTLQQLQQSNPTEYQQVTQQIATNLQSAAQNAQNDGNSSAAGQLNQLATDFTSASKNGQLPNIQDLAKAIGGGHHHHHHSQAASDDTDASASSSSSSTSSNSSSLLANSAQNQSLNPMAIILSTLSNAGISGSNA
jgi:hypothetical protein